MARGKPIRMKRSFGYVAVTALALSLLPRFAAQGAEQPPADSGPVTAGPCQTQTTQTDLNLCFEKRRQAADAELGRRYDQLMSRLAANPQAKDLLRQAERAWIAYRDADCAFVASGSAGGSAQPMVLSGCLADMTRERISRMDSQLTCKEGDLSCVAPAH